MTPGGEAALVLDEHLTAPASGLRDRGIDTRTVQDFHATSIHDPDVIRAIAAVMTTPWVLVTLDGTIVDEAPNFEWDRYAIAWIVVNPDLRGIVVERAKAEIVHRHAHRIVQQRPGDHFTYTRRSQYKHPPSLVSARQRP